MTARVVGYWRRARSRRHRRRSESRRRRPPDGYLFDSGQGISSDASSGDRRLRDVRTVFLCGCRIDVSFSPRGRRSGSRSASLVAEASTASLTARAANILELDPGELMKTDDEAALQRRMSRGTRRRLALCGFDVYATPVARRSSAAKRRRSDREPGQDSGRVRLSLDSSGFEYESSLSSSRVGEFVYSSTALTPAPMLEPRPQFETPPPDDASDMDDDLSDSEWFSRMPVLATDLTLGAFPGTRPRSRVSVGCNGWITADSPPKTVARLSEIAEGALSPEQSQFSVGMADDTGDTISKYTADSFRGPMAINFDLISTTMQSESASRSGEPERTSDESSNASTERRRRRVSPAGSFSLDDVATRRSGVPYRITEDATLLALRASADRKAEAPPAGPHTIKADQHSLLPFLMKRMRQQQQQPQQQQQQQQQRPLAATQDAPRPSIIYIDCNT